MKRSFLLIAYFIFIAKVIAQPLFPLPGKIYTNNEIPKIFIYINPDSLAYIYSHVYEEIEYHATFVFKSSELTDSITNVGFSLRGNTSRASQKKSFQVAFNAYTQGAKFEGVEKLNLNGEHNDPSIIRSKLCWDVLREFKCPGARANHVEVYINGNYYGLYINVEHIDEEFIKSRFGNNDGNQFKCLYPADLNYLGNDPNLYKLTNSGRRVYELKINEEVDDYSDLARFIEILNNVPATDLHLHLDSVFNTNAFLKVLCVDILTGNWDGYSYNKNNFYLYHNTQTGKFEYLAYDLDNTLGIDWFNIDWGNRNIYSWTNSSDNLPLYTKVLQNQTYRSRFTYYMNELLNQHFSPAYLNPKIDAIKDKIQTSAEEDTYRTLDYRYTTDDFNDSYTTALGAHVKYGLKPFISERYTNTLSQLENTNTSPIISYVQNSPGHLNQNISIKALVEDETTNPSVFVKYRINSGNFETIQMFDDGSHNDGIPIDKFYGTDIPSVSSVATISYYIEATDANSQTTRDPASGYYVINITSEVPALFINEFMASNSNTIADEYDEYDDWIEIYNAGNTDVFLGDKYLTDNLANPKKWQMPAITLQAKQFILFWADDSYATQGLMHTNYKLSADGEQIGIFDSDIKGNIQIDAVTFGSQEEGKSYGRYTDGANNWFIMPNPTPGASNIYTAIRPIKNEISLVIYPNPVSESLHIRVNDNELKISEICFFNIYGQLVDRIISNETNEISGVINRDKIKSGLYTLKIEAQKSSKTVIIYRKIMIL